MKRVILILILILAFALRVIGINPGYPPYHSDEGISYSAAVEMIKNNNFDPLRYDYPAVVPLTNYFFFKTVFIPLSWGRFYVANAGKILEGLIKIPLDGNTYKRVFQLEILGEREVNALIWGRAVTAFFGTGIVALTYLVAKKVFDENTALLCSLLVAVNYRQVLNSHLGLPDIYNAFFLLLAFLWCLNLIDNPSRRNYLFASITAGLSFATKYQFFAFFPLFLSQIYLVTTKKKWRFALLIPLVIILVFLVINPYLFIKIEETVEWLTSVSGKYRVGANKVDLFALSYLYHFGLGKITSVLVIAGLVVAFIKNKNKFVLLLSVILSFFYVTVYYTGGGFYTRNFVTITPFLLVLAGCTLSIFFTNSKKNKYLIITLGILLTTCVVWENFENAIVVPIEYSSEWNYKVLEKGEIANLPAGSKVAAHSSVPLVVDKVIRLPYDFDPAFSVDEFAESGADYAIANLDWATGDFYWWMTTDGYWQKPIEKLERSYAAMALRELSQFSVFSAINLWQAPESGFIVAKIPKYKVVKKKEFIEFKKLKNDWRSDSINIQDWKGFYIDFDIKVESGDGKTRDGFVYVKFYKNSIDAKNDTNVIGLRLSDRQQIFNKNIKNELIGKIPEDAKYAVIGADLYIKESNKLEINLLKFYKADIDINLNGIKIEKINLDDNILFPNSHGYL